MDAKTLDLAFSRQPILKKLYKGIFSSDRLPNLEKNALYIINESKFNDSLGTNNSACVHVSVRARVCECVHA